MKSLILILSFTILALAIKPGIDLFFIKANTEQGCCGTLTNTDNNNQNTPLQSDNCNQSTCNPFQICNSCLTPFQTTCFNYKVGSIPFSTLMFVNYIYSLNSIAIDIWQPPKLV